MSSPVQRGNAVSRIAFGRPTRDSNLEWMQGPEAVPPCGNGREWLLVQDDRRQAHSSPCPCKSRLVPLLRHFAGLNPRERSKPSRQVNVDPTPTISTVFLWG